MDSPDTLIVDDYPHLAKITESRVVREISLREAYGLYEHYWTSIQNKPFTSNEKALVDRLVIRFGTL